jgi:hypothetical protein
MRNLLIMIETFYLHLETVLFIKSQNIFQSPSHNYNTRFKDYFAIAQRLTLKETKPEYMGKKFFHSLPEDIKIKGNLQKLKSGLKNIQLTNVFITCQHSRRAKKLKAWWKRPNSP